MTHYKLLLRLRVQRDCAWERRYHRKIRGRLCQAIDGTPADRSRETNAAPFTFSDPMPYAPEFEAGDDVHLVVTARDVDVLRAIASDLSKEPEVTAGAFIFETRAATPIAIDVGPPGSAGEVVTASGIVLTVSPSHETDSSTPEYWNNREYDVTTFRDELHDAICRLLEHEGQADPPDRPLFDDYDHRKTYAVDVEVTPKNDLTVLASKWNLAYEVRDETHRRQLNEVLALGVGAKRSYGFGCLQTRRPDDPATTAPEVAARA